MRWRHRSPPLLLALLRAAASRSELARDDLDPIEARWATAAGFGPLLAHVLGDRLGRQPPAIVDVVRGADLSARVMSADRLEALAGILDRCARLGEPPTLLKGISVCEEFYPAPHLRPMADIDLLVDEATIPRVEHAILALGYRRDRANPPRFYETHHHTAPFTHPDTGVWIEVHRDLFPPRFRALSRDPMFGRDHVRAERRLVQLRGRPAYRLSPELQLVYLTAHWALELRRAGGLIPILDVVYLLGSGRDLDWRRIVAWLGRSPATGALHLALSFVARHGLGPIPPEILTALAMHAGRLGRTERAVLLRLLDRHLLSPHPPRYISARNARIAWGVLVGPSRRPHGLLALPFYLLPRLRGRGSRAGSGPPGPPPPRALGL